MGRYFWTKSCLDGIFWRLKTPPLVPLSLKTYPTPTESRVVKLSSLKWREKMIPLYSFEGRIKPFNGSEIHKGLVTTLSGKGGLKTNYSKITMPIKITIYFQIVFWGYFHSSFETAATLLHPHFYHPMWAFVACKSACLRVAKWIRREGIFGYHKSPGIGTLPAVDCRLVASNFRVRANYW